MVYLLSCCMSEKKSAALMGQRRSICQDHRSQRVSPPANDLEQDDHESDHQKSVNQAAGGEGSDQSEQPQDDQNDSDGI
jgi:hypothetical protein